MIHCIEWNDSKGDLVDIDYQCSLFCMDQQLDENHVIRDGIAGTGLLKDGTTCEYGAYPCGSETDYDVYCSHCELLLWKGLENGEL